MGPLGFVNWRVVNDRFCRLMWIAAVVTWNAKNPSNHRTTSTAAMMASTTNSSKETYW